MTPKDIVHLGIIVLCARTTSGASYNLVIRSGGAQCRKAGNSPGQHTNRMAIFNEFISN